MESRRDGSITQILVGNLACLCASVYEHGTGRSRGEEVEVTSKSHAPHYYNRPLRPNTRKLCRHCHHTDKHHDIIPRTPFRVSLFFPSLHLARVYSSLSCERCDVVWFALGRTGAARFSRLGLYKPYIKF